jgi:hypothetical protein
MKGKLISAGKKFHQYQQDEQLLFTSND